MTTTPPTIDSPTEAEHDWREAGVAWGHAANDWACLYEHYADEVIAAMFQRLGVGPGISLVDIACGAGRAVRHAEAIGATAAGIDAAADLIDIARSGRQAPTCASVRCIRCPGRMESSTPPSR